LKSLPEKVSIVELLKGKKMSRCDLEKKKLYDLMQFMVLHSYERLEDLFKANIKIKETKTRLANDCRASRVFKIDW
jgi:hypothetical protein